ncbi:hypothetical protein V490_02831, partial [Pseudogymnoascus sp. VKM F-3557]
MQRPDNDKDKLFDKQDNDYLSCRSLCRPVTANWVFVVQTATGIGAETGIGAATGIAAVTGIAAATGMAEATGIAAVTRMAALERADFQWCRPPPVVGLRIFIWVGLIFWTRERLASGQSSHLAQEYSGKFPNSIRVLEARPPHGEEEDEDEDEGEDDDEEDDGEENEAGIWMYNTAGYIMYMSADWLEAKVADEQNPAAEAAIEKLKQAVAVTRVAVA